MNKIFSFGKKGQSPSRPSNKPPSSFGVQTPNSTEGYLIRSKDLGKIHKAAFRGDVAKVQQLLLLGKNSVNDLDKVKRTPLHLACANGHPDVVCLLVERKCQLNLLDKDSRTPLMKAIECQQEECATILLEHGADPNLGDARNNNALHYIASGRTKFMAEKLVKHKIDIEAKNKEGLTPLLLAVSTMNFEMAGFLLKNGANVNALDSCKRTALMIAVSVESIGLVTLLLQNNADYTLQDIAGWTAQTYAERYGYPVHIYHKQIEKQLECNNSCPPQISCSEETSGIVPSLDKKAENSSEDSISRLSDKRGPDDTLPSTDDEMDFDTECSHKSLPETSARRLFVSRNQNIKEKISLRKSEDFIEEFDLTDADDIDDLKQKSEFKGSSDRNKETFDKRDQEQHSHENHLEISTRHVLVSTNQNIKDSISLGQHEGHLRRNSNGKPIQPALQMKDSFISQEVGKGVKEKLEFDVLKWDSTSISLIKESHKSSNNMKLQSDFLGKSLTVNQHQLASTKFERIPSKEGEAVAGIGPVTDYKVGVQLAKPVPKKECSKEIKLQSNYTGNSLSPSQHQSPCTIFEKIPSIIGEAVVGTGLVIDYKTGVQLEKPVPQKEYSKDMKLQNNYPGKSFPQSQNQLPSTKFEKIPSIKGEAVVGIGPVIDYKIGVQLEKPVPQKECSKDMKLKSNYPGKSLPLSQNQLPCTIFEKIPSIIGEAVVGIGPAIDYKVGVQLEKPVPQKECSKDMKLQSNYPGKSLPLSQNQLQCTKFEKIPSIIGEAVVGIGPVIDYKIEVQLEKTVPQECSKDMKLKSSYSGKSLPLSQNQLPSTRFGKILCKEGEAMVAIGPVIDYKVGVQLEKPVPQECSKDMKLKSNYSGKSLPLRQNQLPSTRFGKISFQNVEAAVGLGPIIDYKVGVQLEKSVPQNECSKDMKLQSNYPGKSLPWDKNQLASTRFGKIPSKDEAVIGIGPAIDYKVGVQLEKPVLQECSKDMKLQSDYPAKSLPVSQNQLASAKFEKIPSQEDEVVVVGSGHVIDYKVGVQLEKPVPQKQCEPLLQKEKQKEVKKDLKQELKFRGPSELPEASSALAKNLSDSVEKEKDKGPLSVDLQSFPGQREDSSENVFLKNLKISFSKNVLQFSSYMCSKKSTPQSKNKPKIEHTCKVNEENIAYVAKNIKRVDSKFSINKIKEDRLFGIEMTFSQHKNITNFELDSGLLQLSGPGSHFGVQLTHSGNMTSTNQEKPPELITARKCKEKRKHIETSFQNSHHNATNSTNEGRYSLPHGDKISKMCLDKELKQEKESLTNELGTLQAESLTLKKEKIQPQKEVEEHQQNKMNTLERKDDDELTENRRTGNANEQFSVESYQHGKDEENKIPGEEIPIMSISSKEYLAPVHHVLKGSWREETTVKHQRNYYSFGKFEEKEIKIGENVKMSEDEKWISKDSSTTCEKVNSSSGILLHSHEDSETDSDELRLTKITLHEKNKDEVEMAADVLDNLTQSHDRATRAYDLSPSNYVQGSPCLQEDQNAVLLGNLSVKFKNSQLTQLTRKVMSLENTIRELQENFSERIKTEFRLMHQKGECDTCRGRLESEKQNKEKQQTEIGYPSCVSSAILDMEHQTSKLNLLQERDKWLVLKDQLIYKIGSLSTKLSKAENEINQLRDSLREKTLILENTHRELNQAKDKVKEFEHKNYMEKEKSDRSFLTKVSMQEGLTQMQRGIQLLPEPFEDVQNKEVFKIMVSHGVQEQFNDRSMTLYAENENQDCMVEERNKESDDEYIHLRKQIHKYENEKAEGEHVIRKLQELVHFKKEESMTSQEIISPHQKVLDVKPIWKELDQSKSKLQESQEENEQLQWWINELEDYVQKIKMENSILEDSVKEQMCKNENFQKNILDTTLTQGAEKDNLGKQMEDRLQELKAELSQMKISNEKCMAELETHRGLSQDSEEYAGLYLTSSWFGVTEPTNIWSLTDLYQKIFWNNF